VDLSNHVFIWVISLSHAIVGLVPGVTLRRPGIPVGPGAWDRAYLWAPGAWDRAYLWAPALGTGHTCGPRRLGPGMKL
jgi:hypothetical protein